MQIRLTSETGTGITQGFTWDANSNRLSDGAGGYSYAPNTNREVTSPQGAVVVDGAGYTTSDRGGARSFTWTPAGDMATATMSGTTATYTYRDDHLRASKTVGGSTTLYHYDLNGRLIAETTAAGATIREYVWDDDAPVAQVTGGVLAYLHTDQLGTPRLATNAAKTVVWRWNGKAFGESAPAVGTVTVNLRFPGQYFDAETGLHYNWHRYYDPAAGRYLSSDPIGVEGGINTFGYVGGNPLVFNDPYGLFGWADMPTIPQSAVDFSAGFGDSMSFGLTGYTRAWFGIGSVNKCSSAYRNGEIADLVFEAGTIGLSAGLKALAASASRSVVRNGARPFVNAYRKKRGLEGGFVHHSNPLFGHPGGIPTAFPTGGLPATVNSTAWNLSWYANSASHSAAHRRMRNLENAWGALINPATTAIRSVRDMADDCACQQ